MPGYEGMTNTVDALLTATTLTSSPVSPTVAAEDRSGSSDQALATIVIGLFTLIATITIMYLIARGGRRR